MLTHIHLTNFKCFRALSLPLAPLTLLTGFNAAGKSTSLQTLLLLTQALRSGNESPELPLNGPLASLGSPGEVLNGGGSELTLGVENEEVRVEWRMAAENRSEGNALRIRQIVVNGPDGRSEFPAEAPLHRLLPPGLALARGIADTIRETLFISAVRLGTAEVFPAPESATPVHADVGMQGEFAPWWFERFLDEEINPARCHPGEIAQTLRRQFNAWAGELFPGAQGNAQRVAKTSLMRLELRIGDTDDWQRPANIGYGLTYAFPVLVAGLLAKPGQVLIIDSPEAHLHPMGQSRMGRFLGRIAAAGVQVLVETHSDHVLNGVRLAVREGLIEPPKVAVHFFNHAHAEEGARITSPRLDRDGNISEWPEGFFDQSERDLACLAGWE